MATAQKKGITKIQLKRKIIYELGKENLKLIWNGILFLMHLENICRDVHISYVV